jgi:hypothetical protein
MLNHAETTSSSTTVSLSPVFLAEKERETSPLPSLPVHLSEYVMLRIGQARYYVSPTLRDGYHAACQVHAEMEENTEYGAYIFLSGSEYADLARQFMPAGFPPTLKREWHRGFVLGWNACTLVL